MTIKIVAYFLGLLLLIGACKNIEKKDLAVVEKQELAKGIRQDSLFQGLFFGMPEVGFFNHCREVNKKGLFNEGASNTVEYQLGKQDFFYEMQMNFFPQFKNGKINELSAKFTYKDIDLTFSNGQTEKLLKDVKSLMKKWYGDNFFLTPLPNGKNAYVQVSGNRRILIKVEKEYEVRVIFTDLTVQNNQE